MQKTKSNVGFSLIELMVTIAIMAIVAGIALPSMKTMTATNRISSASNDIVTALNFARMEAVRKGQSVSLAAQGSNNNKWQNGISIYLKNDEDKKPIRNIDPIGGTLTALSNSNEISFDARGFAFSQASISLCDPENKELEGRQITVEGSGRIAVERKSCADEEA